MIVFPRQARANMVTAHEKTPACSQDTPLLLACPNSTIAKVLFGEYGTPSGDCARQENGTIFPFYIQMIVLPRQARDKHRKNSKNVPFSCSGGFAPGKCAHDLVKALEAVRKTRVFCAILFNVTTMILPRQAQDKHREHTRQRRCFVQACVGKESCTLECRSCGHDSEDSSGEFGGSFGVSGEEDAKDASRLSVRWARDRAAAVAEGRALQGEIEKKKKKKAAAGVGPPPPLCANSCSIDGTEHHSFGRLIWWTHLVATF
jgi:hypothetical protein